MAADRPTRERLEQAFGPALAWHPVPGCEWGSRRCTGPVYSVVDLRGPVLGPTYYRQLLAERLGVICYAAGHMNAAAEPAEGKAPPDYAMAILPPAPQPKGIAPSVHAWARAWLLELNREGFNASAFHVITGKGSGNVARIGARRPAMLLEPGFLTDPRFARLARSSEGTDALGRALATSIQKTFPEGGLVGLSNDHAFRTSATDPGDPGAHVGRGALAAMAVDGFDEDPERDGETELVAAMLGAASEYLIGVEK